jgi:hypothetical protein
MRHLHLEQNLDGIKRDPKHPRVAQRFGVGTDVFVVDRRTGMAGGHTGIDNCGMETGIEKMGATSRLQRSDATIGCNDRMVRYIRGNDYQ